MKDLAERESKSLGDMTPSRARQGGNEDKAINPVRNGVPLLFGGTPVTPELIKQLRDE
jgi:hypothetical protein